MMLTRKFLFNAVVICFSLATASQVLDASLINTPFAATLAAVVESPGVPPIAIESHIAAQTFDGLAETLPVNNFLGAQGNDLELTDTVTATGPTSESVLINIVNPLGGPLFNANLNTSFGPQFTVFNITNMFWGTGAGPATISNVEISYVDAVGQTVIVPFAPTIAGDGITTPLGLTSTIPNADLENGIQAISLGFDVSHPVPEPATQGALLLGLSAVLAARRRHLRF